MHSTYIREVPGAEEVILFIHGFLGSPKHFEAFVKKMPDNISVYNILLAGHNGDVKDFGRASMKQWKNQVEDIMQMLYKKYSRIIIVAHSMGTFFAMEASVKYPDKVESLLLMQTPLKIGVKFRAAVNTFKSFFPVFENDPTIKMYRNAHSVKLSFRLWEYIFWIPRYIELFRESKKSRALIKKVSVPTYIFQSKKDELVSMLSMKFLTGNENIHVTVLENSAHFIYNEKDFLKITNTFEMLI